jgi:hypothetical protein
VVGKSVLVSMIAWQQFGTKIMEEEAAHSFRRISDFKH